MYSASEIKSNQPYAYGEYPILTHDAIIKKLHITQHLIDLVKNGGPFCAGTEKDALNQIQKNELSLLGHQFEILRAKLIQRESDYDELFDNCSRKIENPINSAKKLEEFCQSNEILKKENEMLKIQYEEQTRNVYSLTNHLEEYKNLFNLTERALGDLYVNHEIQLNEFQQQREISSKTILDLKTKNISSKIENNYTQQEFEKLKRKYQEVSAENQELQTTVKKIKTEFKVQAKHICIVEDKLDSAEERIEDLNDEVEYKGRVINDLEDALNKKM